MSNSSDLYHERYQILEQLGEGGMATVYKAYDLRLEREVAIKVIRRGAFPPEQLQNILARFEREAKSLARLSHPNIVKIHDFGEHDGSPYLVMEYLPGGTLKSSLGQPIPWQDALRRLIPIARGLAFAHERGIIHRDVKPANIIISESGEPMLTDFGIAKLLEKEDSQTLTASGVGIGTPEYMAPEQGIGQAVDARVDIYSLGVVLYEMLTGCRPYTADTPMAVVLKQISDPLPSPRIYVPDLPESVEYILVRAMAKKPEDRFENMGALCKALEEELGSPSLPIILTPESGTAKPVLSALPTLTSAPRGKVTSAQGQARRLPLKWLGLLGAAILIGMAGFGFFYFWRSGPDGMAPLPLPIAQAKSTQPAASSASLQPSPLATKSTPAPNLGLINPGRNGFPLEIQLLVGIFKLEGTDLALTKEQATALLPIWNNFKTINRSLLSSPSTPGSTNLATPTVNTAAQAQKDALITKMLAAMTPEQLDAIASMKITQETAITILQANAPGRQPLLRTPIAGGTVKIQSGGGLIGDLADILTQLLKKRAGG
ncbi:MAG: serine/threonine-protein kinase [Chloroflexi bacterium]|nr:serine/threonine-protein kinase [Chloroflexota bacterium]